MKPLFQTLVAVLSTIAVGQASDSYLNSIRQVDLNSGVELDAGSTNVADNGTMESENFVSDGGARYELKTIMTTSPYTEYLLDERTVGSYFPIADVTITTGDPYTVIPRTRADQPFTVKITVSGLLSGESDPEASKKINFLHHVQSYGEGGTGDGINRDNATLLATESIEVNGDTTYSYGITLIPSSDVQNSTLVWGEERFSVYSLTQTDAAGYTSPSAQLASKYVQIWPVGTGEIDGITDGQKILFAMPQTTLTYKNIYPGSTVSAQVYRGPWVEGTVGTQVPGSSKTNTYAVPINDQITLTNWDGVFDKDDQWTIELVAVTPFGTESLGHRTFTLDRTIEVNGNITTSE